MSETKYKTFADLKLVPAKIEPVKLQPETPVTPVTPDTGVTLPTPVAPVKNFQKVTNTITREAIPNGLFKSGKSKQLYDVLYSLTRGAIKPSRTVQISKPKLREMSGISSEKTLNANLLTLQLSGLILVSTDASGKHGGNIYEVLTPEELTGATPVTPATPVTMVTSGMGGNDRNESEKQPSVPPVETTPRTRGSGTMKMEVASTPKTLSKTFKEEIDDERRSAAFIDFELTLDKSVFELTNRKTTVSDKERWKHVADILVTQLEIIASRTPITNAPAILAEHLHRLLNSRRAQEQQGLITPAEAKLAKDLKKRETIPDLHLCPDCFGTNFWNPDGKGRRAGCPHQKLEEARHQAAKTGDL